MARFSVNSVEGCDGHLVPIEDFCRVYFNVL